MKKNLDGHILLDIDSFSNRRLDCAVFFRLLGIMGIRAEFFRYDRTRKGWHIIIRPTKPLQRWEILLSQAILGSDKFREAYNKQRLNNRIWLNQLFEVSDGKQTGND